MNVVPNFIRRAWRRVGLRFGWIKPTPRPAPDALIDETINRIVNSNGAWVVATETHQGMAKILSYMEKNNIAAFGVCHSDLGNFRQLTLPNAIRHMHFDPVGSRVVVMIKGVAGTGWSVPERYQDYWQKVHLVSTFIQREPWKTQFNGRLRPRRQIKE